MRIWGLLVVAAAGLMLGVVTSEHVVAQQRETPYYASINASRARMRTGPGRNYPATWLYRRADLPIKVVDIYKDWRKIEDPDGTQGWMLRSLLKDERTAMVTGTIAELHSGADAGSPISWRAEPGVVGTISKCANNWCWFDVQGRAGYIEESHVWGVDPGETLP